MIHKQVTQQNGDYFPVNPAGHDGGFLVELSVCYATDL